MCFQLQPFSRLMSSSFSVRVGSFHGSSPFNRHARVLSRHPRLSILFYEDVDGRDKPGHDACFDSSCGALDTDAITNSGLPIRTTGTLRGS